MSAIFGALRSVRGSDTLSSSSFTPIIVLVAYSFGGAGLFYLLEKDVTTEGCGMAEYWKAVYFANTALTTIGYGNVYPCTDGGKIATVIYSFIGIPLTLVVLDILGQLFAAIANAVWTDLSCCCCCFVSCCRRIKRDRARKKLIDAKKKEKMAELEEQGQAPPQTASKSRRKSARPGNGSKVSPSKDDKAAIAVEEEEVDIEKLEEEDRKRKAWEKQVEEVVREEADVELETKEFNRLGKRNVNLPLWIGLVMILSWIAISAAFFSQTEGWYFLDAVYFMFISVTTIGFGDFAPLTWELAAAQFFFIFLGLALFSLCIALVQQSLERLQDKIQENIFEAYKASLESGNFQEGMTIEAMVKKEGGFQRFLLSKKAMKELEKEYNKAAGMQTVGTQTPVVFQAEIGVQVREVMFRKNFDTTFRPVKKHADGSVKAKTGPVDNRGRPNRRLESANRPNTK